MNIDYMSNFPNNALLWGYRKLWELGMVDLDRWTLFSEEKAASYGKSLKKRYPKRNLFPFASFTENDDIACFEEGKGKRVVIVHDFASEGWESRQEYEDFWEWLRDAVRYMIEFEREEEEYALTHPEH